MYRYNSYNKTIEVTNVQDHDINDLLDNVPTQMIIDYIGTSNILAMISIHDIKSELDLLSKDEAYDYVQKLYNDKMKGYLDEGD